MLHSLGITVLVQKLHNFKSRETASCTELTNMLPKSIALALTYMHWLLLKITVCMIFCYMLGLQAQNQAPTIHRSDCYKNKLKTKPLYVTARVWFTV